MSNPETVFILGAGASAPYGLPTGKVLREDIFKHYPSRLNKILANNPRFQELFEQAEAFADRFKRSNTSMIDLYLNRNPNYLEIGKEAIVLSILNAESNCKFGEDASDPKESWYSELLSKITSGFTNADDLDFSKSSIGFVTFNYDRTLEAFLFESLSNAFTSIHEQEIISQINTIPIIHLFGQYAPLPWEVGEVPLEFRSKLEYTSYDSVKHFAKNIEILYDDRSHPRIEQARDMISNAEKIFFLGFGYAKENLKLLGLPETISNAKEIFCTNKGIVPSRFEVIRSQYFPHLNRGDKHGVFMPFGCLKMIQEYC